MDAIFLTGLIGSVILVIGAAWPDPKKIVNSPLKSVKNWFFVVGNIGMLLFAILGYMQGGPFFFVILEILIAAATLSMMLNIPDKVHSPFIILAGIGFSIWSLFLFENYGTIVFVFGLTMLALGYAFKMKTIRRSAALTLGSVFLGAYSYMEASWIFFWLNVFFGLFSAYYLVLSLKWKPK